MAIFYGMVRVLESFWDQPTGIEGRHTTNAERVKEKAEHNVTLTTLRRDLNCLLQMVEEIVRARNHPEKLHVMEAADEKEVTIKE